MNRAPLSAEAAMALDDPVLTDAGSENSVQTDERLMHRRIEECLPLVENVVLQVAAHFPRHVDRRDLARAGALGLVEAARRYDASFGVPFEKYAARRIRGAMIDAVRSTDWAPRSVRTLARRLEEVEQELAASAGGSPADNDVAAALGLSPRELRQLRSRVFRSVVLALEHVVTDPDDENLALIDVLADRTACEPSEMLEGQELLGYLRNAVELLPDRHREVIVGYFLESRTSVELAEQMGVTESRISQLRTEALHLLRAGLDAQYGMELKLEPCGRRTERRREQYVQSVANANSWRRRAG